jgi:hypothetical protein
MAQTSIAEAALHHAAPSCDHCCYTVLDRFWLPTRVLNDMTRSSILQLPRHSRLYQTTSSAELCQLPGLERTCPNRGEDGKF